MQEHESELDHSSTLAPTPNQARLAVYADNLPGPPKFRAIMDSAHAEVYRTYHDANALSSDVMDADSSYRGEDSISVHTALYRSFSQHGDAGPVRNMKRYWTEDEVSSHLLTFTGRETQRACSNNGAQKLEEDCRAP